MKQHLKVIGYTDDILILIVKKEKRKNHECTKQHNH